MPSAEMEPIVLCWQGPFSLPTDLLPAKPFELNRAGVYLWTIQDGNRYQVHYIGYSEDLRIRHYEHLVHLLGGFAHVPLFDGITYKYSTWYLDERGDKQAGKESWEGGIDRVGEIFRHPGDTSAQVRAYVERIAVFLAFVPADEARTAEYGLIRYFKNKEKSERPSLSNVDLRGSRLKSNKRWIQNGPSEQVKRIIGLEPVMAVL